MGKDTPAPVQSSMSGYQAGQQVQSLDDLFVRIQRMIDDGNDKIEEKIDCSNKSLVYEISTLRNEVQKLKADCTHEFQRLSVSFDKTEQDVRRNQNSIGRIEKSHDLILAGVPYSATEKTDAFLRKVAYAIGYSDPDVPIVFTKRLARIPVVAGATPPILVQFAFKAARDEFFFRYLSKRNLNLLQLGFNVNRRVFLNENLTESARRIKGTAIKLKKDGLIQNVFTKDGVIYVKSKANLPAQPVLSLDQLGSFGRGV